jgi:hypothetical protein
MSVGQADNASPLLIYRRFLVRRQTEGTHYPAPAFLSVFVSHLNLRVRAAQVQV